MASTTTITNPKMLATPLGVDADVNVLPESVDASESANASLRQLFPMLTELPESSGGYPPTRRDMNALFQIIGEQLFFLQTGGHYQWDATTTYKRNAVVQYNGVFYVATQGNNLGNPPSEGADNDYWERLIKLRSINGVEPDADGNVTIDAVVADGDNTFTGLNTFRVRAVFQQGFDVGALPVYTGPNRTLEDIDDNEIPTMKHVWEAVSQGTVGGGTTNPYILPVTILAPLDGASGVSVLMEFQGKPYHNAFEEFKRSFREVQVTTPDDEDWSNLAVHKMANADSFTLNFGERLQAQTTYMLRARDRDEVGHYGPWSTVVHFSTGAGLLVEAPKIVSITGANTSAVPEVPTIVASEFSTSSGEDRHDCSDWVITTLHTDGTPESVVYQSLSDRINLTQITIPRGVLKQGSAYTIKVRYKGAVYGWSDYGSSNFATAARFSYIETPSIIVEGDIEATTGSPAFTSSEFKVHSENSESDSHVSTSWVITDLDGEQVWALLDSKESLFSVRVPFGYLETSTSYIVKCQYKGYVFTSEWGQKQFTTAPAFDYTDTPTLALVAGTNNSGEALETPTFQGSPFKTTTSTSVFDSHSQTEWRLVKQDAPDDTVWELTVSADDDSGSANTLTRVTIPRGTLAKGQAYILYARYTGVICGPSDWGAAHFTTAAAFQYILKPTLTVTGAPTNVPENPTLTLTPFDVFTAGDSGEGDTHKATDWLVLDASTDATVWSSEGDTSHLTSVQVPKDILQEAKTYKFRARYQGYNLGYSEWAEVEGTTVAAYDYVSTPSISITAGAVSSGSTVVFETPTFTGSAFAYVSSGAVDTHQSSEWKITTAADTDTPIWEKTVSDGELLTVSVPAGKLTEGNAYKVFLRYKGTNFGYSDWAVLDFSTNSAFIYIAAPSLSVAGAPASVQECPALNASAFSVQPSGQSDTHESTDWKITKVADGSTVWESSADTSHKTSIQVPKAKLTESTQYKAAVRYKGTTYGYSAWTEVLFTTAGVFSPIAVPEISVEQDALGVYEAPLLFGSPFVNTSGIPGDTHSATDWKVIKVDGGDVVWSSSSNTNDLLFIQMPTGKLEAGTQYTFAVRYQALTSGWGPWVESTLTTQAEFFAVNKPTLMNANVDRAGTKLRFEFSIPQTHVRPGASAPSALRVKVHNLTKEDYVDQFTVTSLSTDGNYVLERENAYDLSSSDNFQYEVFYKSNTADDDTGAVSAVATRTATINENILVMLKSISPDLFHVYPFPSIEIELNFGPTTFTHTATDWWICDATNTETVWESKNDQTHLTAIKVEDGLRAGIDYTLNVKAHGTYQEAPAESKVLTVRFRTGLGVNHIGTPGKFNFGVGVYDGQDTDLTSMGLTLMPHGDDPYSDNYGNYQHTNGSVFVWIPAFCYTFEPAILTAEGIKDKSPSAFAIKSFSEFNYDETEANEAGYILHRAFIDGGKKKHGFFITKYLMGKGNKATKGNIPISLVSSGSDAPSKDSELNTDCSGVAHDALTISKKLGSNYNCASGFMYAALAMLSYVHGLYADSTEGCAWYDPEGTTNFPKGCNNNALGDANDGEILYTNSDTSQKSKPDTGSANHFARTTHNGCNSGVCDLNGCIEQVATGVMGYGSGIAFYISPESVKLTDFTKDNVNNYSDTKLYASVGNIPEKVYYWGSTNANTFFTDKNGNNRAKCGLWPNASSASGVNEFGADYAQSYCYDNSYQGLLRCCGSWSQSTAAGVFYRYVNTNNNNNSWTNGNATWGFRAAAYV